ncbi:MAG: HD domain-containing protein [Gemmatimonadaceae bacterium]
MRTLDIPSATVGDRVQHEFLVLDREERRQASGDPYIILTLGNGTGRIATAPVWLNQMDWIAGAEQGRVVQVIGEVSAFQRRRQLRLTSALRVLPAESVVPEEFLARISVPAEQLWDWIDRARADLRSLTLRRAVDRFYSDDSFRVEFERMPASVAGHHALVGGLLLHTTEVATLGRNAARVLKANAELVVAGALLHDVGKSRAFAVTPTGFVWTALGRLSGSSALGAAVLEERLSPLVPNELSTSQLAELHHLVQCTQSESGVRAMTLEAEILQTADGLSVRAADLGDAISDDDAFGDDSFSERVPFRVGHRIWRRTHSWD